MAQGRTWCVMAMWLSVSACADPNPLNNLEPRDVGASPDPTDMRSNNPRVDMTPDETPDMRVDVSPDVPPPVDQHEITIATFNVESLFDDVCDTGRCESDDFEQVIQEVSVVSKIERLQRAIDRLDADVIVFQEVETRELFDRMTSKVRGTYPTREFGELGTPASLDVGIISKFPLIETRRHRSDPIEGNTRFTREFLEVHLNHASSGRRLVVFGAHFISKRSGNETKRKTEARGAARISKATRDEFPGSFVVVAGDLNDNPGSETLLEMTGQGMTNAVSPAPEAFYTYVFGGERQTLDHLLFWDGEGLGSQEPLSYHDDGRSGFGGSDHGAALVTFTIAKP